MCSRLLLQGFQRSRDEGLPYDITYMSIAELCVHSDFIKARRRCFYPVCNESSLIQVQADIDGHVSVVRDSQNKPGSSSAPSKLQPLLLAHQLQDIHSVVLQIFELRLH